LTASFYSLQLAHTRCCSGRERDGRDAFMARRLAPNRAATFYARLPASRSRQTTSRNSWMERPAVRAELPWAFRALRPPSMSLHRRCADGALRPRTASASTRLQRTMAAEPRARMQLAHDRFQRRSGDRIFSPLESKGWGGGPDRRELESSDHVAADHRPAAHCGLRQDRRPDNRAAVRGARGVTQPTCSTYNTCTRS